MAEMDRQPSQLGRTISDIRQQPEFFAVVADRIWNAWWKERGRPREYITARLRENLNAEPIPFALVAHEGSRFIGTISVIASDMDERPQHTPWVAAAWVEEGYRRQGVGAALVEHAASSIFAMGLDRAYLCATREQRRFYLRRGWTQIEEDVGERALTILIRDSR